MISYLISLPIKIYQIVISPFISCNCRYKPSCSHYALEAIDKHGTINGIALAIKRILRCNPWGGYGYDPVPQNKKGKNHE